MGGEKDADRQEFAAIERRLEVFGERGRLETLPSRTRPEIDSCGVRSQPRCSMGLSYWGAPALMSRQNRNRMWRPVSSKNPGVTDGKLWTAGTKVVRDAEWMDLGFQQVAYRETGGSTIHAISVFEQFITINCHGKGKRGWTKALDGHLGCPESCECWCSVTLE